MGKFKGPQEMAQAEEEAKQKAEEQEEIEEPEQPEQPEEPEEPEEPEQPEQPEEGEESEENEESSKFEEILKGHSSEQPEEAEDGEEPEQPEEPEEESGSYEPMNLDDLSNDEFEEITTNPEKFKEFIKSVRADAVAEAKNNEKQNRAQAIAEAKEEILRNIPEIVSKTAERTQNVKSLRDNFFNENPALKNKLSYVKDMTEVVSTSNPDWTAKQVLDEVASRAKRDLDLSEKAEERENKRKDPKFAGAGGRRSPDGGADSRSKQQKLMDNTFG